MPKTYRALKDAINQIPENHLDDNITFYMEEVDEFYPVSLELSDRDSNGVLDEEHPFFDFTK